MTRLLLVEDNLADARLFAELLREISGGSFALTTVDTLAGAIASAAGHDVVFLDLSLPIAGIALYGDQLRDVLTEIGNSV